MTAYEEGSRGSKAFGKYLRLVPFSADPNGVLWFDVSLVLFTNLYTKLDVYPLLQILVTHFSANSITRTRTIPLLLGNERLTWT
jgi:hypothetical protein